MIRRFAITTLAAMTLLAGSAATSAGAHAQAPQTPSAPPPGQQAANPSQQAANPSQQAAAPSGDSSSNRPAARGRLPGQDCGGLGACAWRNRTEAAAAACTPGAAVCVSRGAGGTSLALVCSSSGAINWCRYDPRSGSSGQNRPAETNETNGGTANGASANGGSANAGGTNAALGR
jgi:hypothetical protein